MKKAPVLLFTFNRPEHTEKTLDALSVNEESSKTDLFIFSDGPRDENDKQNVNAVRVLIALDKWKSRFKSITISISKVNRGLAASITSGVSKVFTSYDSVIVLEDDLVTSSDFILFMNSTLTQYAHNDSIGSISAYNPLRIMPFEYKAGVYLSSRSGSLGWGTWKNVWENVDWDACEYKRFKKSYSQRCKFNATGYDRAKRLDLQMTKDAKSWSILFGFHLFVKNLYTVYASDSKLIHIGWDGSGTHNSDGDLSKFNDILRPSSYPLEFPKKNYPDEKVIVKTRELFGNSSLIKLKDFIIFLKNKLR
jgi:hypothetical protein